MNASVLRLCSVVVFLLLVIGCAGVGDKNPKELTVANLQGTYDLNTGDMPGDLAGGHDGFNKISEMFEIDAGRRRVKSSRRDTVRRMAAIGTQEP